MGPGLLERFCNTVNMGSDNIARQLQNKSSNRVGVSRYIYDIIRFPGNQAVTAKTKDEI
jgi:hypothetical protein